MVATYNLQFDKITDETSEVKTFRINTPPEFSYITGQFYMLRLFDKEGKIINETRAYSCSSHSQQKGFVEFTIQLVGSFTHKLWERKVGDKVEVKGPMGHVHFTSEMKEPIFLAGAGSGVTPLRAILRHVADQNLANEVTLLYSVRKPDLVIYRKEFQEVVRQHPNIKIITTITRLEPQEKWDGRTGRIDEKLVLEFGKRLPESRVYMCGPIAFCKAVEALVLANGAKKELLKMEAWG